MSPGEAGDRGFARLTRGASAYYTLGLLISTLTDVGVIPAVRVLPSGQGHEARWEMAARSELLSGGVRRSPMGLGWFYRLWAVTGSVRVLGPWGTGTAPVHGPCG